VHAVRFISRVCYSTVWLGMAGFALLTKYTAPLFVPPVAAAVVLCKSLLGGRSATSPNIDWRRWPSRPSL
jgi:hypothetical protein